MPGMGLKPLISRLLSTALTPPPKWLGSRYCMFPEKTNNDFYCFLVLLEFRVYVVWTAWPIWMFWTCTKTRYHIIESFIEASEGGVFLHQPDVPPDVSLNKGHLVTLPRSSGMLVEQGSADLLPWGSVCMMRNPAEATQPSWTQSSLSERLRLEAQSSSGLFLFITSHYLYWRVGSVLTSATQEFFSFLSF